MTVTLTSPKGWRVRIRRPFGPRPRGSWQYVGEKAEPWGS